MNEGTNQPATPEVSPGIDSPPPEDPATGKPGQSPSSGGPALEGNGGSADAASAGSWTPELRMQLIKEIVTAVLAFLIIIFTLVIAWRSFNLIGNAAKVAQAKDVLTVMLGVAGVVVGYYFGRVSGDARASQANASADNISRQNANLKAKAHSISANLNHVIDGSAPAMAGDSQAANSHIGQLRSLRDELYNLGGPSTS